MRLRSCAPFFLGSSLICYLDRLPLPARKRCKGRCVPDMDCSPADNKAVARPVPRRSARARDRGAAGTTILPSGLFQHGDTEIYARSLRGSQMKLAQKVKIALDETRMLVLGAQI